MECVDAITAIHRVIAPFRTTQLRRLSCAGDDPELLQQAQLVQTGPALNGLPVDDAVGGDAGDHS